MITKFSDNSSHRTRAYQAYLILIGLAHQQKTIYYSDLCKMMEYGKGSILGPVLDVIMRWCEAEGLPPLTSLVVQKGTGVPGDGMSAVPDKNDIPAKQQQVFAYDWFSIFPPFEVA